MYKIAPSLLAADFADLPAAAALVNESEADWFHLDVMDGRFVPNLTFGMLLVEAFNRLAEKPLDVHLMMLDPERYIERFREAGADWITVHAEACPHLHRTVQQIKESGAKAGVALNPHTSISQVTSILEEVDLVCIMSVNPGFGGQKFIYSSLQKIEALKEEITVRNLPTLIEVDGGVGLHNAERLLQAGADVLVAGSAVFKSENPKDTIRRFKAVGKEKQL